MFGNMKLKAQIVKLELQNQALKNALIRDGHQHESVEWERQLLNGYDVSNGTSSEYAVTRECINCGQVETQYEIC